MVTLVHMLVWPHMTILNRSSSLVDIADPQLSFYEPHGTGNGLLDHVEILDCFTVCL